MSSFACGTLDDPHVRDGLAKAHKAPVDWVITVAPAASQRTPAQNRFYRRLLAKLAQQLGHSVSYWHESLVEKFLGFDEILTEDGYTRRVLASTTDQSVAEFSSFLNACLVFAHESQVDI